MSGEIAFIGDVHGEADALRELLKVVAPKAHRLVFLGDYVNRGDASRTVLDHLLRLAAERPETVFLKGNHDEALLGVLHDSERENEFLRMGGASTIRSYVSPPYERVFDQLRAAMPQEHLRFLESLESEWTSSDVIAAHHVPKRPTSGESAFVVAGHWVQHSLEPVIKDGAAFIDTGCGTVPNGRLTAFYWPTRAWDQVPA